MTDTLDLTILDSYANDYAIVLARREDDTAISKLSLAEELKQLAGFRERLDSSFRGLGTAKKPSAEDVMKFGQALFRFAIQGELLELYNRLPQTHVTLKILSNHGELRQLPWEYLQEPKRVSPRTGRCVVRIVPTIGLDTPPALPQSKTTRILLVAADPIGLRQVDWQDIEGTIRRAYSARLKDVAALQLDIIEGSDRTTLEHELRTRKYDIVHFSCHGDVNKGMGRLILINSKTKGPAFITAQELGQILSGRGIRLVILSACETSFPSATEDFGSIAETLVREGIPAVVGNQAPVPNSSVAIFVEALYRELLESGNIDKAVTQGRVALAIAAEGGPEWGITTLHRLGGAAQLYLES